MYRVHRFHVMVCITKYYFFTARNSNKIVYRSSLRFHKLNAYIVFDQSKDMHRYITEVIIRIYLKLTDAIQYIL